MNFKFHRPASNEPARKALPANLRAKSTPESIVGKYLGEISYSKGGKVNLYVQPLWTSQVSNANATLSAQTYNNRYMKSDLMVEVVHGTFEDALETAAKRASQTVQFNQAQAIFEGAGGDWLVAGVGSYHKSRFLFAAVDGASNGKPFEKAFGRIESVTRENPNFVALVGAEDWLDFREESAEQPVEETTAEPIPDDQQKQDPWAVSNEGKS